MPHPQGPDARPINRKSARPGLVLSTLAAICAALLILPPAGILVALFQDGALRPEMIAEFGWFLLSVLLPRFRPPSSTAALAAIPMLLLFLFAITYLVAFCRRASWGPRFLAALALIWAISAGASTVLLPILAMPGGLPLLTFFGMVPGIIAPTLFAVGFAGFMLHGDVARTWFGTLSEDARA